MFSINHILSQFYFRTRTHHSLKVCKCSLAPTSLFFTSILSVISIQRLAFAFFDIPQVQNTTNKKYPFLLKCLSLMHQSTLHKYKKMPEITNLYRKNVYFYLQFQSFQIMTSWLSLFLWASGREQWWRNVGNQSHKPITRK